MLCYIIGCPVSPVLTAVHKRFGVVVACKRHHPLNGGLALLISERPALSPQNAPVQPAAPPPQPSAGQGGQRVPVTPRPQPQPPLGGHAVTPSTRPLATPQPAARTVAPALIDF